jgi:hypothetical protein
VPLEVLHFAFVVFGCSTRLERPEIASLACTRIKFSRVEAIVAGGEFTDHKYYSQRC